MTIRDNLNNEATAPQVQALLRPGFLDYAVHISTKHRYIYVVNPKVGCSSILWSLRRFELGDKVMVPPKVGVIHDRENSPLHRPSDFEAPHEIITDIDYFKFTFVRNPFDRLMSCYLNKIARPTAQRAAVLRTLGRPEDDITPVSLATFVDMIAGQTPTEMDPHWRLQWTQTLQGVIRYDAIGRFETFAQDLSAIGARIAPEFPSFIYSERRQATGPKPYHLITPDIAETIRAIYADDFTGFSYSLDLPGV